MLTPQRIEDLRNMYRSAQASGHPWPAYAACEAALETGWFASRLFLRANNIFGMKQHERPVFETIAMPTLEFLDGVWTEVEAAWVKYPTVADSFADRMATLRGDPGYAAALSAPTGEAFVTEVSKRWSTDPRRAEKVLEIYGAHQEVFTC